MSCVPNPAHVANSPWHDGERAIQQRLGVAQRMEAFGPKVIRDFMPDQHRQFYAQLPLLVLGTVDAEGLPWASVLEGERGFAHSPDPKTLRIDALLAPSDPARQGLASGAPLGLLGIQLHSRRRNRLNGRVTALGAAGLTVAVEQAFGNCPQYIQTRAESSTRQTAQPSDGDAVQLKGLDDAARAMIAAADTFFVTSYVDPEGDTARRQVDVSHRGGKPGFVRIDGDTLTIPDFAGNLHFNTLGNLLSNPRAGLLFVDFESGNMLQLNGRTEIVFDGDEINSFQGAERLWRVTVQHVVRHSGALRTRFEFGEFSPNSLLTGSWEQAAARRAAEAMRLQWRPFRISRIEQESATVRSFHLEPADGAGAPTHQAGQHLPIRVRLPGGTAPTLRTYTLSSAPSDAHYRISVKRQGAVSSHLHDRVGVGDIIEARAPQGAFTLDAALRRPAVLLSGGVGVTPMLAMLRHVVYEGQRTRHTRPTTFIHGSRNRAERPFELELQHLVAASQGAVKVVQALSNPEPELEPGVDFHHRGRIDVQLLKRVLPFDDHDFYLCGPAAFMQGLYDQLRDLQVADERIHAEAFGPARLLRRLDGGATPEPLAPVATLPVQVVFARSGKQARWTPESGSLLELAESSGLTPEFSCRGGSCGTCRTAVVEGAVTYAAAPDAPHSPGEALICCAVPVAPTVTGADAGRVVLDL